MGVGGSGVRGAGSSLSRRREKIPKKRRGEVCPAPASRTRAIRRANRAGAKRAPAAPRAGARHMRDTGTLPGLAPAMSRGSGSSRRPKTERRPKEWRVGTLRERNATKERWPQRRRMTFHDAARPFRHPGRRASGSPCSPPAAAASGAKVPGRVRDDGMDPSSEALLSSLYQRSLTGTDGRFDTRRPIAPFRHARTCSGHPCGRLAGRKRLREMPGTSPCMTRRGMTGRGSGDQASIRVSIPSDLSKPG